MNSESFEQLLALCRNLTEDPQAEELLGVNFIDVPEDKIVVRRITFWPSENRKVQVNTTTDDAKAGFTWLAEITIDDRDAGQYSHYLVQADGTIVETYGKKVSEVAPELPQQLIDELSTLS
jgi:broad specificity polyphosphatase/5'/3'-nucleotidase SurE